MKRPNLRSEYLRDNSSWQWTVRLESFEYIYNYQNIVDIFPTTHEPEYI